MPGAGFCNTVVGMLPQNLAPAEVRVLGALIEKELSTPDNYPLSLHSLTAACNQSSNRDPVTAYDSDTVMALVTTLRRQDLIRSFQGSGERVPKYLHLLAERDEITREELAVLCVLMLRGPQTLSEVRTRASRLLPGDDADAIESALNALIAREPSAVTRLARRPGQKETRFAHLLAGEVMYEVDDAPSAPTAPSIDRISALEQLVQELQTDVTDLRAQLDTFRKQFE